MNELEIEYRESAKATKYAHNPGLSALSCSLLYSIGGEARRRGSR